MMKLRLLQISLCLGAALACAGQAMAQQASLATNPSGKPFFKSVDMAGGEKRRMDFSVRSVGSVKGRVFIDAELSDKSGSAEQHGISGVKVSLRSRDIGFENYVFEQFTDETGSYSFEDLRPGKYTIEIDAINLPSKFQLPEVTEAAADVPQTK